MSWNTYANRGMELEQIIEISNQQYKSQGQAIIQKVPTPVKVLKTERNGRITGFWEKKSTVDFVGVFGVKAVAFDAKQTKGKSLPLQNIEQHQIDFMLQWRKQGHQAFIVVNFSDLDRYFRLDVFDLVAYMKKPYESNKKSIPVKYFEEKAAELGRGNKILLDYLKGIV